MDPVAVARARRVLAEARTAAYNYLAATAEKLTCLYQGGHLPPDELRRTHARRVLRLAMRGAEVARLATLAPPPLGVEHLAGLRGYLDGVRRLSQMVQEVQP